MLMPLSQRQRYTTFKLSKITPPIRPSKRRYAVAQVIVRTVLPPPTTSGMPVVSMHGSPLHLEARICWRVREPICPHTW